MALFEKNSTKFWTQKSRFITLIVFRPRLQEFQLWLGIACNTQKSPYQNTSLWQIPCQVYEPVLSMRKIKMKTTIETHLEQKFGASMATWQCPAALKSPCTKIIHYDKSLVKFMSQFFQWGKSKWKQSLEPIQSQSLEHPWPIGIAPQHSKVPVRK